jgi:hypothetical protein
MVHIKHASVAGRTVMTAIGLEYMTHQSIPLSLVLRISHVETPIRWDLPGVSRHCLEKAPHDHCEQEVKNC